MKIDLLWICYDFFIPYLSAFAFHKMIWRFLYSEGLVLYTFTEVNDAGTRDDLSITSLKDIVASARFIK